MATNINIKKIYGDINQLKIDLYGDDATFAIDSDALLYFANPQVEGETIRARNFMVVFSPCERSEENIESMKSHFVNDLPTYNADDENINQDFTQSIFDLISGRQLCSNHINEYKTWKLDNTDILFVRDKKFRWYLNELEIKPKWGGDVAVSKLTLEGFTMWVLLKELEEYSALSDGNKRKVILFGGQEGAGYAAFRTINRISSALQSEFKHLQNRFEYKVYSYNFQTDITFDSGRYFGIEKPALPENSRIVPDLNFLPKTEFRIPNLEDLQDSSKFPNLRKLYNLSSELKNNFKQTDFSAIIGGGHHLEVFDSDYGDNTTLQDFNTKILYHPQQYQNLGKSIEDGHTIWSDGVTYTDNIKNNILSEIAVELNAKTHTTYISEPHGYFHIHLLNLEDDWLSDLDYSNEILSAFDKLDAMIVNPPYADYTLTISLFLWDLVDARGEEYAYTLGYATPDLDSMFHINGTMKFGESFYTQGQMVLNAYRMQELLNIKSTSGTSKLHKVVLHEALHLLGIGALTFNDVLDTPINVYEFNGKQRRYYTGENALREYSNYFPDFKPLVGIPIEYDDEDLDFSHAEEGYYNYGYSTNNNFVNKVLHPGLGEELSTAYLTEDVNGESPLSRITLGFLNDMGFTVDYSKADDYTPHQPYNVFLSDKQYFSYEIENTTDNEKYDDDTYKQEIHDAFARWEGMMTSLPFDGYNLFVKISFENMDSNTLGGASIYYTNSEGNIPLSAEIEFNVELLDLMLESKDANELSMLHNVATHEIGHTLGIGAITFSSSFGKIQEHTEQFSGEKTKYYIGENALKQYKSYLENSEKIIGIPVEDDGGSGTAGYHAEEGNVNMISTNDRFINGVLHPGLNNEIMTGWDDTNPDTTNPISRISLGFLQDLGYHIDYDSAEEYSLVSEWTRIKEFDGISNAKVSNNGNVFVNGTSGTNAYGGNPIGSIQIYRNSYTGWKQEQIIEGPPLPTNAWPEFSSFGEYVDINSDGNIVVASGYYNSPIRVFKYHEATVESEATWKQLGNDINDFAHASISDDGKTIICGKDANVAIFKLNDSDEDSTKWTWTKIATNFTESNAKQVFVNISGDASTIMCGRTNGSVDGIQNCGVIEVYKINDDDSLIKLGQTFSGKTLENARIGYSQNMDITYDGKIIAICCPNLRSNYAEVFEFIEESNIWQTMGGAFNHFDYVHTEYQNFGYSISISSNGKAVAIGANNAGTKDRPELKNYGNVIVLDYIGNKWIQRGDNLIGENSIQIGTTVSITNDVNKVATTGEQNKQKMFLYEWM